MIQEPPFFRCQLCRFETDTDETVVLQTRECLKNMRAVLHVPTPWIGDIGFTIVARDANEENFFVASRLSHRLKTKRLKRVGKRRLVDQGLQFIAKTCKQLLCACG